LHNRFRRQCYPFSADRQPDPKGDRINVVLSGKFLPYKPY
jgi:cyanase